MCAWEEGFTTGPLPQDLTDVDTVNKLMRTGNDSCYVASTCRIKAALVSIFVPSLKSNNVWQNLQIQRLTHKKEWLDFDSISNVFNSMQSTMIAKAGCRQFYKVTHKSFKLRPRCLSSVHWRADSCVQNQPTHFHIAV